MKKHVAGIGDVDMTPEEEAAWLAESEAQAIAGQHAAAVEAAKRAHLSNIKANQRRQTIITYLNNHTDTEIMAYVDQADTLVKLRQIIKDIALIIAGEVRD